MKWYRYFLPFEWDGIGRSPIRMGWYRYVSHWTPIPIGRTLKTPIPYHTDPFRGVLIRHRNQSEFFLKVVLNFCQQVVWSMFFWKPCQIFPLTNQSRSVFFWKSCFGICLSCCASNWSANVGRCFFESRVSEFHWSVLISATVRWIQQLYAYANKMMDWFF